MPTPQSSADRTLQIRRTFAAPREKVFAAWTRREQLEKWIHPRDPETLVTVEFFARGDATEVVLMHILFGSAAVRDRTDQGWNGCFDMLEKALQSSVA